MIISVVSNSDIEYLEAFQINKTKIKNLRKTMRIEEYENKMTTPKGK